MLNPDQIQKAVEDSTVEIKINEERSWESFANDKVLSYKIESGTHKYSFATVSCESFHDGIHVLIGTGSDPRMKGHMGNPSYAAVSLPLIPSVSS